jgi:hypothetical protein
MEAVAIACDRQRECVGLGSICNVEGVWQVPLRVLVQRGPRWTAAEEDENL